jgi:anti-sigma B factor antagonist
MTNDSSAQPPASRAEQMLELGSMSIRSQRDGEVHTIALDGEIDIATAGHVEQELLRAEATDAPAIVLDLSKLSFIDSTGIRMLVMADARTRADGCRLTLRRPPDPVLRVLHVAGVAERLRFAD